MLYIHEHTSSFEEMIVERTKISNIKLFSGITIVAGCEKLTKWVVWARNTQKRNYSNGFSDQRFCNLVSESLIGTPKFWCIHRIPLLSDGISRFGRSHICCLEFLFAFSWIVQTYTATGIRCIYCPDYIILTPEFWDYSAIILSSNSVMLYFYA